MPWLIYAIAVWLKPLLHLIAWFRFEGAERLPAGGFVIAPNHVSWLDPFTTAMFIFDQRIPPRFLAKAILFDVPVVGWVLRSTGQIPTYRATGRASEALRAAVAAVHEGKAVIVYPEGTMTRDPDVWPMSGKSGAVRIALETGKPLVPIAQWGPHAIWPPYTSPKAIRIFPRRTVRLRVGEPIDLSDFEGRALTTELLEEATDRLMDEITRMLVEMRGAAPTRPRMDAKTIVAAEALEKAKKRENKKRGRPDGSGC